jgi:hypothetical protein
MPQIRKNHPSFNLLDAEEQQPALQQLQALVEEGFGVIYADQEAAEQALGGKCFPAPLGDVVKSNPDGPPKHRLIQDLRRNGVNACVHIPERQVLPRFVDHALDLARASSSEGSSTLILDFKHTFMTVPAAAGEQRFNCCLLETSISRQRDAIAPGEPTRGSLIVWQVLGFGGRSYPLLYARVASWLARATQAMLHTDSWSRRASWGPAAVQVYVDDPAIVVSGSSAQQSTSIDLAILWWLVLGIPLSWRKGAVHAATEQHVWIGVEFRLLRSGVAQMTLPPA